MTGLIYQISDSLELTGGSHPFIPTLSSASVTNSLTSKKRKSPTSEDISSQKKLVDGDSSQSPATDAYSQAEPATLKVHRKRNRKSSDREAAVSKVSAYSSTDCNDVTVTPSLEDRKLDIARQSLNTQAAESIKSQDTNAKKRKRSKKKSIPNADSICEANDKANGSVVSQDIDSAPSTVCDQTMEPKEKKRNKRRKSEKLVSNDDVNYGANDISSQEKSDQVGELSLSVVSDKCNQAVAEVSQTQRKKHNKDVRTVNRDIDSASSTVCSQTMEPKAKKRKRPRKSKKFMDSVSDADRNCIANGFSSQEKSHKGGDLSLSVVSFTGNAVAEVLQQQRKEIDTPLIIVNRDVDSAPSTVCDQSMKPEEKKTRKQGNRRKKKSKEIVDSIPSRTKEIVDSIPSRKLVILDLNGLLADIRSEPLEGSKPHRWIVNKAVYKRPFCDDFVQFCFETFDVAVWSSRKRKNVQQMLSFLMKQDLRKRLIFTWNQSHCTRTGFMTIENKDKPIFLKELQKYWNKSKRVYNESNTLLIDDSPCKALRNPPYTGIFPNTYECSNTDDNSLGPDGDLRLYLKRLAEADNVEEFVKENPFGQIPITNTHPSWAFYSNVLAPKPPSKRSMRRTYRPRAGRMNKKTVFDNLTQQA